MKFLITFIFTVSFYLYGAEYAVVVDKKNQITQLSSQHIRDVFLARKQFIGENKVIPINLDLNSPLRLIFEEKFLELNREKLNRYWVKKHFQGVSPPYTQSSIESLKVLIKKVNGAIGYIPQTHLDSDLRVLYEF